MCFARVCFFINSFEFINSAIFFSGCFCSNPFVDISQIFSYNLKYYNKIESFLVLLTVSQNKALLKQMTNFPSCMACIILFAEFLSPFSLISVQDILRCPHVYIKSLTWHASIIAHPDWISS